MAPPKKDIEAAAGEGLRALCVLMASSDEFNPDYNTVATALGIAQAKNVPRKIDSIIKPYGYVIKSKKIVKLNEDGSTPDVPATPKAKAPKTPITSGAEDKQPATPRISQSSTKKGGAAKMKKSPTKKVAAPSAKKRKIEEDESGDDDEATKLIKENVDNDADGNDGDEVEVEVEEQA